MHYRKLKNTRSKEQSHPQSQAIELNMFFSVPACTHNIRLYVSELGNVWIMLFHTSWIFTNSKSQSCVSILITKNILHQLNLLGKNVIDFLGNKNFVKDKNSSRPLNTSFGRVTIKMQHSLTALQWNTQQRCILKCSKTICDQSGIIEIVARRHFAFTYLTYSYRTAKINAHPPMAIIKM